MVTTLGMHSPHATGTPLPYMPYTKTTIFTCEVEFATTGESLIAHSMVESHLRSLDSRFSRFNPDSETSRFNAAAGAWFDISRDMHGLLCESLRAAVKSKGLVNIAILKPLIAAGYGQNWPFAQDSRPVTAGDAVPLTPLTEILEIQQTQARLAPGHSVDFGAIAKGVWADEVTNMLGPNSICSLGGDVACRGGGPSGEGWPVRIPSGDIIQVVNGGVATSGSAKRRWANGGHHIIDPRTGMPSASDVSQTTVLANCCTTAEWVATSIVIGGTQTAEDLRRHPDVSAVFEKI